MDNSVFTLKWGILATGGIANVFAKDLLTDPSCRNIHDLGHQIVAVASSSSRDRANDFIAQIKAPYPIVAYGSYHELAMDSNVQIIYIATPHSHHFQNAMLALEAGKHVLCEKPLTVTAKQTQILVDKAKEKRLFFMEAVWTRFLPVSVQIEQLCRKGAVGTIHRVIADISFNSTISDGRFIWDDSHRALNKDLAGGALLDIGVYAISWVFLILYQSQPENVKEMPRIISAVNKYEATGVDEMATVIVQFPKHNTMGVAMTGLRTETGVIPSSPKSPSVQIQGSEGEIQLFGPAFKPSNFQIHYRDGRTESFDSIVPKDPDRDWGHGMFWEADECARCLRDGKTESDRLPLNESVAMMNLLDEVLKEGGIRYPDSITSHVYDPKSPQNQGSR